MKNSRMYQPQTQLYQELHVAGFSLHFPVPFSYLAQFIASNWGNGGNRGWQFHTVILTACDTQRKKESILPVFWVWRGSDWPSFGHMPVLELIILVNGTRESGGKSWRGGGELRWGDFVVVIWGNFKKRKAVLGLCEENGWEIKEACKVLL